MTSPLLGSWTRICRAYETARETHERAALAARRVYAIASTLEECEVLVDAEEAAFERVQAALAVMGGFARACCEDGRAAFGIQG